MGKEAIQEYFGLSYANYLVLPRAVLQSMPADWQARLVALLEEIGGTIAEEWQPAGGYRVLALDEGGKFTADPYSDYERGRRRLATKDAQHGEQVQPSLEES